MTFSLRTPSCGSGLPVDREGRGTYRATPLGLSARPLNALVHYSLEVSLDFRNDEDRVVSSILQKVFDDDTDLAKLAKKFIDFRGKVAERFPYFSDLPHLRTRTGSNREHVVFELWLPPFTGFFVGDGVFWKVLRFPPDLIEHTGYDRYGLGGRFGVSNRTSTGLLLTSGELQQYESPATLYVGESDDGQAADSNLLRVEVEVFTDWLPQTLAEERKLDLATAGVALARLLSSGLLLLNLNPAKVIEVDVTEPGKVQLKSAHFTGNKGHPVVLGVRLSTTLQDYFVLPERTLLFPSNDPRTVALTQRVPPPENPLEKLYPVHLMTARGTAAHHFVHGQGWVGLLGLLSDPTKFLGRPEWVEISAGQTELRLLLVDRWCRPVASAVPTEFILHLELVDLF